MLAATLYRLIPSRRPWLRRGAVAFCLVSALVVAASRVWLGVHYPTDVMAGLALGVGWAYSVALIRRVWSHWRAWAYPKA